MRQFDLTAERERLALTADCASCFGLCCVAHGFRTSASFAYNKRPGTPCHNLLQDFGCNIHGSLRQQGFSGCTAYTCFGAGQKIAQVMFGGISWRDAPGTAELMFQTLPIMRQLHELLWYITEALDRCPPGGEYDQLRDLLEETELLTATEADELSWGDIDAHCQIGETLLGQVSRTIRDAAPTVGRDAQTVRDEHSGSPDTLLTAAPRVPSEGGLREGGLREGGLREGALRGGDLRGAELSGADLRGADLCGADFRGADLRLAMLSNADLSGADLRWADLMGADLGRTNLAGADLSAALFLTQSQLELADGNAGTVLSHPLQTPAHWPRLKSGSAGG